MNPASRTQRAKRATCGLMPGISLMTITAGPEPATYTRLVTPVERDLASGKILQRIVFFHAARSGMWLPS